ncbi:MAG: hypothetical protein WC455_17800 [Dehalococcoidia bacterium]
MIQERPCKNTDKEIWRRVQDDYYSPSIHVTKDGDIGINLGGNVLVAPLEDWHAAGHEQFTVDPKSNMNTPTLKNCPFCGVEGEQKNNGDYHFYHQPGCFLYATNWLRQASQVISWNRRTLPASIERLVDALEGLLDGLDANADERCGLTQKQWDKRIHDAGDALTAVKKEMGK